MKPYKEPVIVPSLTAYSKDELVAAYTQLWLARDRDSYALSAMRQRFTRWHPVRDLLYRKPWRKSIWPGIAGAYRARNERYEFETRPHWIAVAWLNIWSWVRYAHDCSDPSIACSCSGGFRFSGGDSV